jgi:hypothetical protein
LAERIFEIMEENLTYYMSLEPRYAGQVSKEAEITHAVMGRLAMQAMAADSTFGEKLGDRFQTIDALYQGTPKQPTRRMSKARF